MARALAIAGLVACLSSSPSAWAQDPAPPPPTPVATGEPASLAIAMGGVVLASAGFGLMLRTTGPCYCEPRTAWVIGGVAVVAAGVTLTWLGLRSRTVTIAPVLDRQTAGGLAVIRWGRHAMTTDREHRVVVGLLWLVIVGYVAMWLWMGPR